MTGGRDRVSPEDGQDSLRMAEPDRWLMNLNMSYEDMLRSSVDWLWETNARMILTYVSMPIGSASRIPPQMQVGQELQQLAERQVKDSGQAPMAETLEARQGFRDVRFSVGRLGAEDLVYGASGVPFYDRRSGQFLGYRGTGNEILKGAKPAGGQPESDLQILGLLESALARKDQLEWELSRSGQKTIEARLASIAHELRTPLNAIIGFAEMIKTRALGEDVDRYAEYGGDIHDSAVHMVALVNNLIDLAKIDTNGTQEKPESLDVREVAVAALRMLEDQAVESGVSLINNLPNNLPRVRCERRALRQIFINLLSNAIKYTKAGGAVGVEVEPESEDETALSIVVWDTGVGIPTDQQDKIFERTYRVQGEANAGKPGSGLGLSISRDLARSIGGEITVASQPGQGARFTLRLPTSSEEATAA